MKVIVRLKFGSKREEYESKSISISRALEVMRAIAENKPANLESAHIECESMAEGAQLTSLILEAQDHLTSL